MMVGMARTYRSPQREERAQRTRRRVLDAATAVFLDRGYTGATMRVIAAEAGVSVPTVELLFGAKARLLKAAIDVAIAGDDEPVPVLERDWAAQAARAGSVEEFLDIASGVIGAAQVRSAGLVLAVFEGARNDPELAELAGQMTAQRSATAGWLVDALTRVAPLRAGCTRTEAIDTLWILMDPAVFDRLTRQRGWTTARYQQWLAGAARRLLIPDNPEGQL
jgi:AcrR family transcriptional regulator